MGSAKISNAKPQLQMEKPVTPSAILTTIKKYFKKKNKAIEKPLATPKEVPKDIREETVANILDTFKNLDLKEKESKTLTTFKRDSSESEDEEDELSNFTYKVFEDGKKRHPSADSRDSGYSETKEKLEAKDVIEIDKLKLNNVGAKTKELEDDNSNEVEEKKSNEVDGKTSKDDEGRKKKKTYKIVITRGPLKNKIVCKVQPYSVANHDLDKFRQISQINKQILSGGQVIVNTASSSDDYSEVDQALKQIQKVSSTSVNQSEYWQDVLEYIHEDSQKTEDFIKELEEFVTKEYQTIEAAQNSEDVLKDFKEYIAKEQDMTMPLAQIEQFPAQQEWPLEQPVETYFNFENDFLNETQTESKLEPSISSPSSGIGSFFPTPPRSENVPSPMSESQVSVYPPIWENSLSERSSPLFNTEYEKYQEIPHFEELSPISQEKDEKQSERSSSVSSMTMKNFKDMQKEISNEFSKKDCCQINRKTIHQLFDEYFTKLKAVERKNLCFKVANMDLKSTYGVLHHILLNLATSSELEALQYSLFVLISQRVLAQTPTAFLGDFGLSLLKSAVMRCPHRPLLARFVVHYVYSALKQQSTEVKECIFHEVDAQGDNLVIACARGGDVYALALAEITRSDARGDLPPLFRVHHANTDGYTALHVACNLHSKAASRLHTLHVLLEHAGADVWKGDIKGGETALHLAVNSVNCDLYVIMMLFKQLDRKMWKKLAHCQNMSSVTPLEYARAAAKSTTRQNYPQEVLEFLKKCR